MAHAPNSVRCLVTGGAGFIGSHVVRELLKLAPLAEGQVVVLDDLSGGFVDNLPDDPRVAFVHGSIGDAALVDRLFNDKAFDFVYHLAAYAAEGLSHFIRRFNYANNLLGSVNLINAAVRHDVQRFVFTSSIAVYGRAQTPMLETTTPQPEDPYGIAKHAVELDLQAAQRLFGLDYTIFRPHNVYGPGQNIGDPYRNVVGIFMNRLMRGEPLPIFGDGEQRRAFSDVADVAPGIAQAPFLPAARNGTFNIGSDDSVTVNELARLVAEAFGQSASVVHLPARDEVAVATADHARHREVFGAGTSTPLDVGIRRMADWARQVGPRTSAGYSDIEIARGLPPSWASLLRRDS